MLQEGRTLTVRSRKVEKVAGLKEMQKYRRVSKIVPVGVKP